MDKTVQRALVARIMADTGLDEHHAAAMVADVRQRGSESPHAAIVGAAASKILAPIMESFGRAFASMAEEWQKIAAALAPVAKKLHDAGWRPT